MRCVSALLAVFLAFPVLAHTAVGSATAASESVVVKLIQIHHVDVILLASMLGGASIDLTQLLVNEQANASYTLPRE